MINTERNYSRLIKDTEKKGFSDSEKRKMFFFGIFIVIITGTRVFYHLPGNERQKRQTLVYYLASVLFWILIFSLAFFIIEKYNQ